METSRLRLIFLFVMAAVLVGCAKDSPAPSNARPPAAETSKYIIGPGDTLDVFVWETPELSATVPVRPDGKITTPLVEDVQAVGKTPTQLARDLEAELARYLKRPIVTVTVTEFVGTFREQIRVVGQAAEPQALPYREEMTLLDVMIQVGGLTEFAAGNRAKIIRRHGGQQSEFPVRINDLLNEGDISANVEMNPGDIVIIPESWL